MEKKSRSKGQTKQVLVALVAGVVLGLLTNYLGLHALNDWIAPIGALFVRLLKMIIVPLVFASVYLAVLNLGSPESLGTLGKRALIYYFTTSSLAVSIGLCLSVLLAPGKDAASSLSSSFFPEEGSVQQFGGAPDSVVDVLLQIVPTNPFASLASAQMLPVIFFSLTLGLASLYIREKSAPFASFMRSLEDLSLWIIHAIMRLAPIGIFALIFSVTATSKVSLLESLLLYFLTILAGLLIHSSILLMTAKFFWKEGFWSIVKRLFPVLSTAFSTSSSAATLPVTLATLQDEFGVREKTTNFVLPLGATVNMDGTALYATVVTVFVAQIYGIPLGPLEYLSIFLTASLAAIGTAAAPGAGLLTMAIVMNSVGVPLEGIQIVLGLDRIVDMCRTAVNVLGDATGGLVIEKISLRENSV